MKANRMLSHICGVQQMLFTQCRWMLKNTQPTFETAWRFFQHHRGTSVPDEATYLWIDSICINQLDDDEKSIQVASKGLIFKGARRVLNWLGEACEENALTHDNSKYARQVLEDLKYPYKSTKIGQELSYWYGFIKQEPLLDHIWQCLIRHICFTVCQENRKEPRSSTTEIRVTKWR